MAVLEEPTLEQLLLQSAVVEDVGWQDGPRPAPSDDVPAPEPPADDIVRYRFE